ncbi:MAG: phage tail protein [Methylocystis sp.]|nr:MAG: phage tail protein [Methylocystis sp.]
MSIASTSRTRIAYVAQSAFDAVPATPTFKTLRRTSGNLRTQKATSVSDEVHADGNIRDEAQTGQDVVGSYAFELVYGDHDDLIANALCGAWTADVLKNGVAEGLFLFEETDDIGGGAFAYARFLNCKVGVLDLAINSRSLVRGSMEIVGTQQTLAAAIVAGATYAAPSNNKPETSVAVGALSVVGLAPTPIVKNVNLRINSNRRVRDSVGSLYSQEHGRGSMDVTGTMEVYFETNALAQAVLDHALGALNLTVGAVTLKKYTIAMPAVRLLDGARQIGGRNDDVMYAIPFRAVYDSGIGASISITRAVA